MPNPDLTPLLRDRWSPRVFDPTHELADDDLRLILEAARWSPSAGNTQRWSYLVGRRGDETFTEFGKYVARGNAHWVSQVSAVLVTAFQSGTPADAEKPAYLEWAEYDLGQTAAHITVQATALGLHVHQFSGFDHEAVAKAFGVPDHWTVATGIAIGRIGDPATSEVHEKEHTGRKAQDEFVFAGTWGTPLA